MIFNDISLITTQLFDLFNINCIAIHFSYLEIFGTVYIIFTDVEIGFAF